VSDAHLEERRRKNVPGTILYVPAALKRNDKIWQHTNINAKTTGTKQIRSNGWQ
jgi:hypothetical protein